MDFLTNDFGMAERDMRIFFSGHRGYHLHVRTEEVRSLDESQRKEIVDYVMGLGLDAAYQGLYKKPRGAIVGPQRDDPGWRGRLARGICRLVVEGDEDELVETGFSRSQARRIVREKARIKEDWMKEILWGEFEDAFHIKDSTWRAVIERAISKGALPAEIDTVVTTDIHRLIRLPETLNGKTGFRATAVSCLKDFDPFSDAIAFEGELTVRVAEAPALRVGKDAYGPYVKEDVRLPTAAAMLLICKGLGDPVKK
jgi:DNA primase small subunit